MDAFYASIEQRDFPEYRGKPVVVGGAPDSRGVVATASYEARKFGIKSAMPASRAYRLCPDAIFIKPRFDVYRHVSRQIMGILREYTDLVEPLSLDEAYLDVTNNKKNIPLARDLAHQVKARIFQYTGLTASAGVAPNKFLAKVASDLEKPDGLTVIAPEKVAKFVKKLPVSKVPGIGRVTCSKMNAMGVRTLGDLQKFALEELVQSFGKHGRWYYYAARGVDDRPVKPFRERKSVSCEDTFERDISSLDILREKIIELSGRLNGRLKKLGLSGRTVTLKVTYSDFEKCTRSYTADAPLSADKIRDSALALLGKTEAGWRAVRLLGVGVSGLAAADMAGELNARQLALEFAGAARQPDMG
ncbi:MAG: DNA polymerase IV [Candidatus Dadabacteria bacterium]|nr:MAG: DNA polymerase IV [Candidatus Dadabacteria bacterium]